MSTKQIIYRRFSWLRDTSVALICFYYYFSLFRSTNIFLGLNVKDVLGKILVAFFLISFVYILFNIDAAYSVYKRARASFIIITLCVSIFTILTKESWLLIPFILFLQFTDDDTGVLAKKLFTYSSICFLATVFLGSILPGTGREVIDKSYSLASIIGTNANSLGFPNSNQPLLYFTVIAINGAYLIGSKTSRKQYALAMFGIATLLFAATLSITGYICACIFLGLYSISSKKLLSITAQAIPVLIILSLIITPIIATKYGNDYRSSTNEVLANRPYLWNLRITDGAYKNVVGNIDKYQSKSVEDKSGYTLDNQYLLLIARYGWILLIIFLYIYYVGIKRVTEPAIIYGLLSLSIYFVFESVMFIFVLSIIPVAMMKAKTLDKNIHIIGGRRESSQ